MGLRAATDADLPAVAVLVNSGFRGEISRQGWTTEADFLEGERTNEEALRADLAAHPDAKLYLLSENGALLGCLWLEAVNAESWYLGMLTVRPNLQNRQIGRRMLEEAEALACAGGAKRMRMVVVHIRSELIAWYERRGYVVTGETQAFPFESPFGRANRCDLQFVVLEKALQQP